jgi:hypothetical protein
LGSPQDGDTFGMQKRIELRAEYVHVSFINLLMDKYPWPSMSVEFEKAPLWGSGSWG